MPENGMTTSDATTYEEIMGTAPRKGESTDDPADANSGGGAEALSSRLLSFRQWVSDEAKIFVQPSVCVVNGEATDGTKNAPVLLFGPPPGSQPLAGSAAGSGRVGMVDGALDRALYERTMGCQVRAAKEIKKDEGDEGDEEDENDDDDDTFMAN